MSPLGHRHEEWLFAAVFVGLRFGFGFGIGLGFVSFRLGFFFFE
jgi:hypothetical protein